MFLIWVLALHNRGSEKWDVSIPGKRCGIDQSSWTETHLRDGSVRRIMPWNLDDIPSVAILGSAELRHSKQVNSLCCTDEST